jgi:hypothetical protein
MRTDILRKDIEKGLWKAGLTVSRVPDHRLDFTVAEYPDWHIRCHQTQQWFLWHLYAEAQAESPDPSSHFALITVDRRDDSEVVTCQWALLEAWLAGEDTFVIPRRKRRMGFAHHSQLQEIGGDLPMLFSAEAKKPILISVSLDVFKAWMMSFPRPENHTEDSGQLDLSLWAKSSDSEAPA